MPLPAAVVERKLHHTREIQVQAFERTDGLWDIEARMSDVKTRDADLCTGVRRAGDPIHAMSLRVTIDRSMTICDAAACSDAVPYPGQCETITPAYGSLVGLNLMRRFRDQVKERLGKTQGCSHLTELCAVLPTAAVQAFAGTVFKEVQSEDVQPFQLDGCHALRLDGEAVRQFYPRWYKPAPDAGCADPQG